MASDNDLLFLMILWVAGPLPCCLQACSHGCIQLVGALGWKMGVDLPAWLVACIKCCQLGVSVLQVLSHASVEQTDFFMWQVQSNSQASKRRMLLCFLRPTEALQPSQPLFYSLFVSRWQGQPRFMRADTQTPPLGDRSDNVTLARNYHKWLHVPSPVFSVFSSSHSSQTTILQ